MATTTPSEFMEFAKGMGLDRRPSLTDPNSTGLAVLNNICHLIEHLHALKVENNRLRAHLDLVNHVERFVKSSTLSPSNSFSICSKERGDRSMVNHHEESSSFLPVASQSNWSTVRHVLRRKKIPAINISVESDEKNAYLSPVSDYQRRMFHGDEDDLSIRSEHKRRIDGSSDDREHLSASATLINDDESSFTRKQSKIAHYRHKLRSKLDTVKKQFSDQIPSSRPHAVLSAKLAPAMTKSYQQKMRDWQRLQKSDFLVNYRRASIASVHPSPVSRPLSVVLSPKQRQLIVQQWREIVSEETLVRRQQDFLQERLARLKQLENHLKELKRRIFSSNDEEPFLQHRSRSLDAVVSMPASWILAVQSAAYSDVLDGTSLKSSERALLFNQQVKHLRDEREHFEQSLFDDLGRRTTCKTNVSFPSSQPICRSAPVEPEPNKRSRFDLKKALQRSKSICVTQFQSWLQRRRQQQHQAAELRRKSAVEGKEQRASPKLFSSPRLARLHQRIFKVPPSLLPDDSDLEFSQRECPVRIYLPARSSPSLRHVQLDLHQLPTPPMSKLTSPIVQRRTLLSAQERRESFAATFHQS